MFGRVIVEQFVLVAYPQNLVETFDALRDQIVDQDLLTRYGGPTARRAAWTATGAKGRSAAECEISRPGGWLA